MADNSIVRARIVLSILFLVVLSIGISMVQWTARAGGSPIDGTYYFTGEQTDQVSKVEPPGTATFQPAPPGDDPPINQVTNPFANEDLPGNPAAIYWYGPYSGEINDTVDFCWYWSSPNATAITSGLGLSVSFFADPDFAEGEGTLIARENVEVSVGPEPVANLSSVPVNGTVNENLLIQVTPQFVDTGPGATVHYGSQETPSAFGPAGSPCPPPGATASPTASINPSPSFSPLPPGPGVHLRLSDSTPRRGEEIEARTYLAKCPGHEGTKVQLRRSVDGKFVVVKSRSLNDNCRAAIPFKADFKEADVRTYWMKQDDDHRSGRSKTHTIQTHPRQ
jgi:hypothetical protein